MKRGLFLKNIAALLAAPLAVSAIPDKGKITQGAANKEFIKATNPIDEIRKNPFTEEECSSVTSCNDPDCRNKTHLFHHGYHVSDIQQMQKIEVNIKQRL